MNPTQWAILLFASLHEPQVNYISLKNEVFKKYAWGESFTLSAINYLLDIGFFTASRSLNEVCYAISQRGNFKVLRLDVKTWPRRGLKGLSTTKLLGSLWGGSGMLAYVSVDTGNEWKSKPDIPVFPRGDHDVGKVAHKGN